MKWIPLLLLLLALNPSYAQYEFSGMLDSDMKKGTVYLSIVEDYRKISGVHHEQILAKTKPDSTGNFVFSGNNLPDENRIYRIHVDTCPEAVPNLTHTLGHCENSEEIVFVANNRMTISLPLTGDKEIFCEVSSNDERAKLILKIDSVKNDMLFALSNYPSDANRDINTKKWIKTLQDYGASLNEPLAELYIYSFLSDRHGDQHPYYLEDVAVNPYYKELLTRLGEQYPNTNYVEQYRAELTADSFLVSPPGASIPNWVYGLIALLGISALINLYFMRKLRSLKKPVRIAEDLLSNQEQRVLELILEEKTNKEIASEMFVSVSTVKSHINNIYKKLQVKSRQEVKSLYQSSI